ncbi:MAG: S9 family peptidase [Planctomycetaceae bacterium]|mgnify:CR=1 FL=1|nr:S9 family peptidase [Planctomycetaceae bacterium]
MRKLGILTCLILILAGRLLHAAEEEAAKKADEARLTVERIFASAEFNAQGLSARWADDGDGYLTVDGSSIVRHDAATGNKTVVVSAADLTPPGQSSPLAINGYDFSQSGDRLLIYTNSKRVWRQNSRGDYWVLDRSAHELRQLGGNSPPSALQFAKLSPVDAKAAYVRDNNLYVEDLRSGKITRLTSDGSKNVINGTFDWIYEEELHLRDGFRWSGDGKSIAYWQIDTTGVPRFMLVDNTSSMYPKTTSFAYPKTGQQNPVCRVGIVAAEGGETRWLDLPGDRRDNYLARMDWIPGTRNLLLQQLNRLQNENRVMVAEADSGKLRTVFVERDKAWVDVNDELMWLDENQQFTWISERDGWRRGYLATPSGKSVRSLTPRGYDAVELLRIDQSPEVRLAYYIASPANATQRYLYAVALTGANLKRLTPEDQPGWHDYSISPNGKWAIHTRSRMGQPPETNLVRLPEHESVRTLVDNKKLEEKLGKLDSEPVEFFQVEVEKGIKLDAYCIKPPKFDAKKKYPLLVYVYGEPAGQTVTDRWSGSGYLWHLMFAQQGYFVMSFDNRGTNSPRGREWRKCIYRQVGILAPNDQAAAVKKVLAERPYLDPDRVGIWGWSGGGSMTLNAILKFPKLYSTAMAVAPVPNQRLYDTIYQERYMGLPGDNVKGYLEGSPVNYAHQLEGNLLLVHGTGDDNCHYQGTEALVNELVRHNRPFTMMAYPNRTHSIGEGAGTTLHLRLLLTRYLQEKLPPGPK